jgi:rhamnosyltransferase
MFHDMRDRTCDFWGATDNFDIQWHIQSYFLVFRRHVLASPEFSAFWQTVLPYRRKEQVIRSYEVGLSAWLEDAGFTGRAYVPAESLFPPWPLKLLIRKHHLDPTCFHPERVLKRRMPYVKTNLLRDNPGRVRLDPVYAMLRESGYDMRLIEHDRAPKARGVQRLVERAKRWLE